jgi:hypothetical protein
MMLEKGNKLNVKPTEEIVKSRNKQNRKKDKQ